MKRLHGISYRTKLIVVYCVTIIAVVATVSLTLMLAASRQVERDKTAHLGLLTEQTLQNFTSTTAAAAQQLYSFATSNGVAEQMYAMRNLTTESNGYYQRTQALIYAINQMITAQTYYDQVYVRMDGGLSFSNAFAPDEFIGEVEEVLAACGENNHGKPQWYRSRAGQVYVVRDVYNLSPIKHMGKSVARIRQEMLSSLGASNTDLNAAVVFLDEQGRTLMLSGIVKDGMAEAAQAAFVNGSATVELDQRYVVVVERNDEWTAVGLLPEATLSSVNRAVIQTDVFIALVGLLCGVLVVFAVTRRLTRQINALVKSMDEVAAGNISLNVPVESQDEIGRLARHFNRMIAQTRELLLRAVQEETSKHRAEYEMLEYRYRSLQAQINPHFIYNAFETVNALAKTDNNEEVCNVVQHISAFFRQNTGNMQKRFIPVRREFDSLKEYAYIYRRIHGDSLTTQFSASPDASDALIPTMILQPVLENALVHGIRPAGDAALVSITACDTEDDAGEWLVVTVSDNGEGMSEERIQQILNGCIEAASEQERISAGIGMKNVRDRLRLIYGDRACVTIKSRVGEGTAVTIQIPLIYEESELTTIAQQA